MERINPTRCNAGFVQGATRGISDHSFRGQLVDGSAQVLSSRHPPSDSALASRAFHIS